MQQKGVDKTTPKQQLRTHACMRTCTEKGGDSSLEHLNGSNASAGAWTMLRHACISDAVGGTIEGLVGSHA